jgi:hypothetical protein
MRSFLVTILFMFAITACASAQAEPASKCVVEMPLDHQVFQRQTRLLGVMRIRGRAEFPAAKLEYRLVGKSLEGRLDEQWHAIAVADGGFGTDLKVPVGGWYRLELAFVVDGKRVSATTVDHVGIGEVFIVAGQSNSTNYGKPRQHPVTDKVSTFDGKSWRIADDPQPGVQDHSTGGSFIPAFGDALVERFGAPIGVACVGAGGTSVREWLPKGERMDHEPTTGKHVRQIGPNQWESTGQLFDGLCIRMRQLGPGGFRAVLWHQGESDAHQPSDRQITADQYRTWVKLLIRRSRGVADVPWFVAQTSYHNANDANDGQFRDAQQSLWQDGTALAGPDTDRLGPEYRNGVHFNDAGLKAHGRLWAEKVGDYLERSLAANPR